MYDFRFACPESADLKLVPLSLAEHAISWEAFRGRGRVPPLVVEFSERAGGDVDVLRKPSCRHRRPNPDERANRKLTTTRSLFATSRADRLGFQGFLQTFRT